MAGMLFNDRVTDITYNKIMPNIVDQINNSSTFFSMILSQPETWEGPTESQTIRIANSSTGGSFSGMDVFPTAVTNNTRWMTWYVAADEQSVVIPGIEAAINSAGDRQVIRMLTSALDEAKISMIKREAAMFYGIGSGKDFDGLGLIVDNGTVSSAYAGITRSTNPFINGDVTDLGSLNSGRIALSYLSSEFDNVSAAGSESESPTDGITTKSIWTNIESLAQPALQLRYDVAGLRGYSRTDGGKPGEGGTQEQLTGALGLNSLIYRARRIIADDDCPSGIFFWLNMHKQYMKFKRLLDKSLVQIPSMVQVTEGYFKDVPMPSAYQFREMMSPVAQYGQVGFLVLMGQLMHTQPRRNGKLINITGV